jgi:hypothetical protein
MPITPASIHAETPQELAAYLVQHPDRRFRLIELTEGAEEAAPEPSVSVLDEKAKAAIALLDAWIAEGKAADARTRQEANREVEEFKRSMNANRAATSERPAYQTCRE